MLEHPTLESFYTIIDARVFHIGDVRLPLKIEALLYQDKSLRQEMPSHVSGISQSSIQILARVGLWKDISLSYSFMYFETEILMQHYFNMMHRNTKMLHH